MTHTNFVPQGDGKCKGYFKAPVMSNLVQLAVYNHPNDIGCKYDDLFNPIPLGLLAFVVMMVRDK